MPKNPHANFTPVLDGYSGIGAFRFWCQTALPLTYDDSLSYYELLNKVVNYLNHTIEDLTAVENNTSALAEAYEKLQKYVNDYFDDLDVEAELRNVLDAMAEDGTLDELLGPIVENQLPDIVDEKIDGVVAEQIDGAVAGQIDESVAEQIGPLVAENIPEVVEDWLDENVDPVGSAVVVDSSLTISGAAADAKVTGDNIAVLKNALSEEITGAKITDIVENSANGVTFSKITDTTLQIYGTPINNRFLLYLNGQNGTASTSYAFHKTLDAGVYYIHFSRSDNSDIKFYYTESTFAHASIVVDGLNIFNHDVMLGMYISNLDNYGTSENPTIITIAINKLIAKDPVSRSEIDILNNKAAVKTIEENIDWGDYAGIDPGGIYRILGWQAGSWRSTDGSFGSGVRYISTITGNSYAANLVTITPPSGKYIYGYEYDENNTFIGRFGTGEINAVLTFTPVEGHIYQYTVGEFPNQDAADYITNSAFIATIVGELYFDPFLSLKQTVEDNYNATEKIKTAGMSMYSSFAVCGASWDSGYIYVSTNPASIIEKSSLSWGANVAKRNGIAVYGCFARHSVYTKTYITNQYCLPALLAAQANELYVINLGGNDSEQGAGYLGTATDMLTYADTFYGNYAYIIDQIKTHAPNSLIILSMWYDSKVHPSIRGDYFNAVKNIAEHYNIPYINWADDTWYNSTDFKMGIVGDHPTAPLLAGIAECWERLYNKCYLNNYTYFNAFVGS